MSKFNIWNTISLAYSGNVKILDSGRELFGTVTKHGVNDKTITVDVSSRFYNHTYKRYHYNTKSKQVHDQYNYCVAGDKVVIANCQKLSSTKAYYVKYIVKPFPRPMTPKGDQVPTSPLTAPNPPTAPIPQQQQNKKAAQKMELPITRQKLIGGAERPKSLTNAMRKRSMLEANKSGKKAKNNSTLDKSERTNRSISKDKGPASVKGGKKSDSLA